MIIRVTASNREDLKKVFGMMEQMIDNGAECVVEVGGGNAPAGHTDTELKEVAKRVRRGDYGNAPERWKRLAAEGFTPEEIDRIQSFV